MLWYDNEASIWEEALPLGNGRIGAMVWSGVNAEKISLNDDTLWSGYPKDVGIVNDARHYEKARALAMAGKYRDAQDYIESHLLGPFTQGYLPLGELTLEMDGGGAGFSDYKRVLDLEKAVVSVSYMKNCIRYERECFVSAPDQAFVMRISADKPCAISLKALISCQLRSTIHANGNRLTLEGVAPSIARPNYSLGDNPIVYDSEPAKQGMDFIGIADFEVTGGEIYADGEYIRIENADQVVVRFCCRTGFNGPFRSPKIDGAPYADNCNNDLNGSLAYDYSALRERHLTDYQRLYKRMDIFFSHDRGAIEDVPLPARLSNWESSENDPALFALLFQFGRYLMISGSRPGTIPLNLQGIWNPHLNPPWSSNYTLNINAEMNYWPVESANLSECHEPLFDFINTLRITGAKIAKAHYNAGGFTVNHNSDLWGAANATGENTEGSARYAFWPLAAGWLSAHVFDHYLYTLDTNFLRETAWPVLLDAARFYLDVMTEDTDGSLIFAPSTSPENDFIYNGRYCCVSKTTTMTTAIIRETLSNVMKCRDLLDIPDLSDFFQAVAATLQRLPVYQIGAEGQLLEWSEDLPEYEPTHRHTSHLYPLYPGHEIKPKTVLGDACVRTLDLRGEEATGWALAWRISLWARLHEAERAFACLKKQLRPATKTEGGCYPNLFGAHPPFQIDSNFGATAGIAELILQSHWDTHKSEGRIHLLPALPKALSDGYVKGLRARGGVTVSVFFAGGELQKAELTLDKNLPAAQFEIIYIGAKQTKYLSPGETYYVNAGDMRGCDKL